jgi:hypothetical protein
MYVALFLTPWMVMYGVGALVLNHNDLIQRLYKGKWNVWEKERELTYSGKFAPGTPPRAMARQILKDLNLDGAYNVNSRGDQLTIHRDAPLARRRLTYNRTTNQLFVEKQAVRTLAVLTGLHTRTGYGSDYLVNKIWAFSVDLAIFATIFWVLSGFWLWWTLKRTRRWGLFFTVVGFGLYLLFVFKI